MSYSPWGHKELDTTERLTCSHHSLSKPVLAFSHSLHSCLCACGQPSSLRALSSHWSSSLSPAPKSRGRGVSIKENPIGAGGKHSSFLAAWGTSLSPQPLLPAACQPQAPPGSSAPLCFSRSLSPSPETHPPPPSLPSCLPSLPPPPGLCWSPGSTLTPACCGSSLPVHPSSRWRGYWSRGPTQPGKAFGTPSAPYSPLKAPRPIWGPEQFWPSPTLSRLPSPWVW